MRNPNLDRIVQVMRGDVITLRTRSGVQRWHVKRRACLRTYLDLVRACAD